VIIKNNAKLDNIAEIFNFSFPFFSNTFIGTNIVKKIAINPNEKVFNCEMSGIQLNASKFLNTPTIEDTDPIIIIGKMLMIDC